MIPSEGIHSLVNDLTRGKLFGLKLSSLYSGKLMAFLDTVIFAVIAIAFGFCELSKGSPLLSDKVKGSYIILACVLGVLAVTLLGKLLLYDMGYWFSWHRKFVGFIRKKFVEAGSKPDI